MTVDSIALQLYTVRDETARDFAGTLRRVAALGYKAVEFAGYGGLSSDDMKGLLAETGLAAASTHVGLDRLAHTPDDEIAYCAARKAATQHYAGRWAAKEAVLKALGTGWRRGISWRDIEVRNDRNGSPVIILGGGARDVMEQAGIRRLHVTISHCRCHAVAFVVAEGDD